MALPYSFAKAIGKGKPMKPGANQKPPAKKGGKGPAKGSGKR